MFVSMSIGCSEKSENLRLPEYMYFVTKTI